MQTVVPKSTTHLQEAKLQFLVTNKKFIDSVALTDPDGWKKAEAEVSACLRMTASVHSLAQALAEESNESEHTLKILALQLQVNDLKAKVEEKDAEIRRAQGLEYLLRERALKAEALLKEQRFVNLEEVSRKQSKLLTQLERMTPEQVVFYLASVR